MEDLEDEADSSESGVGYSGWECESLTITRGTNQPKTTNYEEMKRVNNPEGKPTGHFTGRCMRCGSNDLWDDNSAYGCNKCGAFWCF